jgi:hypothetical protein
MFRLNKSDPEKGISAKGHRKAVAKRKAVPLGD